MSEIAKNVEKMAKPIIEKMGFELVEVTYSKQVDGMELNISLYKEDGPVTIEDCENVSHALDEPLEILNPTSDKPYNLVVGSLGLDRPMTKTRDFERNLNKEIEVKLYKAKNKQKQFVGILAAVDDTKIEFVCENEKLTVARDEIASAKLYIKF